MAVLAAPHHLRYGVPGRLHAVRTSDSISCDAYSLVDEGGELGGEVGPDGGEEGGEGEEVEQDVHGGASDTSPGNLDTILTE